LGPPLALGNVGGAEGAPPLVWESIGCLLATLPALKDTGLAEAAVELLELLSRWAPNPVDADGMPSETIFEVGCEVSKPGELNAGRPGMRDNAWPGLAGILAEGVGKVAELRLGG